MSRKTLAIGCIVLLALAVCAGGVIPLLPSRSDGGSSPGVSPSFAPPLSSRLGDVRLADLSLILRFADLEVAEPGSGPRSSFHLLELEKFVATLPASESATHAPIDAPVAQLMILAEPAIEAQDERPSLVSRWMDAPSSVAMRSGDRPSELPARAIAATGIMAFSAATLVLARRRPPSPGVGGGSGATGQPPRPASPYPKA